MKNIKIIKKNGKQEEFDESKIINAITKSAKRVLVELSDEDKQKVVKFIKNYLLNYDEITVFNLHILVENALEQVNMRVANAYREYRNYKNDFVQMIDEVYQKSQSIRYIGDKENSNTDSALIPTKRSLIYNELNKRFYKNFFLNKEEKEAIEDGFIYIHDMGARLDTYNCSLYDVSSVLKDGFEMSNLWYTEPNSIDTALDVLGDILMTGAASQYGGLTVAEIDKILAPYAKKSYDRYKKELLEYGLDSVFAEKEAERKTKRDIEQGIQGLEMKLNSVSSSRGDFPFITFSFGENVKNKFSLWISSIILKVRRNGQGKKGKKRCVLFPKLVFLYVEDFHGENKEYEWLFNESIITSSKAMYPDVLSLSGNDSYICDIYKKYGKIISLMGCRASLSPWYERGGMYPADEEDMPIFIGRYNIGAVSLHLPLIYQEAKTNNKDFYKLLDYYLEMIRQIHLKTYDYLGKMKASTNPLAFCQGGLYKGNLNPEDTIEVTLESATASFGITALNELQILHNGKSLVQDNKFALDVMKYINKKVEEYKNIDKKLYAVYGTPAESLVGLQVEQFKKRFGIIKDVSDRAYMSNSFHCNVREDISATVKQDKEKEFWNLFNGGKIQYVKYPLGYNIVAIKTLVKRAMNLGLYEGVNLDLNFCDNCGYSADDIKDICPSCDSTNIVKINRMNGYLSYTRVKGDSRLNASKIAEIQDRKSM